MTALAFYLGAIVMFGIAITQNGSRRFPLWMLGGLAALALGCGLSIWRVRHTTEVGA